MTTPWLSPGAGRPRRPDGRGSSSSSRTWYSRSAGGLIVTESAEITPDASAYEGPPGIYTDAQVAGWRGVVDAVHARGGRIVLQLWHPGRVSHASLTAGAVPVGASAVPTDEVHVFTASGVLPATPNRALSAEELSGIARGLPLNPYDRATFYTGGARGYTDYLFSTLPRGENP